MTTPSLRRRDPQPLSRGWELAAVTAGGALIAVALAALAGLGLSSALWGDGWVWPHGTQTVIRVLGALMHGHPGRGLPPAQVRRVAGPVPVYACVFVAELALITTAVISAVLTSRYRRPGDARGGMATRREAEHALGQRQLRTARALIRPDRYAARPRRGRVRCLLSTTGDGIRSRVHRSAHNPDPRPTSAAPSTRRPRPTAPTTKELPR